MTDRVWSSQLKKGLIEMAVLASLRDGEAYGYQLLQTLAAAGTLATTESTLYPMLARLADEKLVAVRQQLSPSGPPRRYYRLTEKGRTHLAGLVAHWKELAGAVNTLLDSARPRRPRTEESK